MALPHNQAMADSGEIFHRDSALAWLTLDALVATPRPGGGAPNQFAFAPHSPWLTYLWSDRGDSVRDLWVMNLENGERRVLARADDLGPPDAALSSEETLRRERQRVREGGITQYHWAKAADVLLIPFNGQLYVKSAADETLRHVAPADEGAVDGRLTADGSHVVYVRGRELWIAALDGSPPVQLTFDSADTVSNGVAEFIAQEEMGRSSGFWPSPDGSAIAYAQVDEGAVPEFPIVHQGTDAWRVEGHRYPFAGEANVRVRLGIVAAAGGPTSWLDLGPGDDVYLARVEWQSASTLLVQIEVRDQQRLELRAYDVATDRWTALLVEEGHPWINLHNDLRILADGRFIWATERSGFKHLSWHDAQGGEIRALTSGDWPVDSVVHVDEARRRVYFTAGREDPRERHLYAVSLDGGEVERLTLTPGFHGAVFAAGWEHFVHTWESMSQAPSAEVCSTGAGAEPSVLLHQGQPVDQALPGLDPPELIELAADDGTRLFGALYRPRTGVGPAPHRWPTVVSVYGGPHAQMVTNTWGMTVDLRAQYLACHGFAVFKLDNRGSGRRGLAFEGALHRRMGTIEVDDQVAGVRWLVEQGISDPERVGIYGWSYGGYMAAMCLLKAPDTFRAAVAGALVSGWDGYDTHYTERYMGTPQANPDGYREAALMTHAEQLRGHLLIVHGMVDENVHFRHSARFITALEHAEKDFDLLLLPEERHGIRPTPENRPVRRLLEHRVTQFFEENL